MKYKLYDKLMYPKQGLGEVLKIHERMFKGVVTKYYTIKFNSSDMTIMVPVDKADEQCIRLVVNKQEALSVIDSLADLKEDMSKEWKVRYGRNSDLVFKDGNFISVGKVMVNLGLKENLFKALPVLEDRLYMRARSLFIEEAATALNVSFDDAQHMINEKMKEIPNDM
jgi:CarD family transcriptional regulator